MQENRSFDSLLRHVSRAPTASRCERRADGLRRPIRVERQLRQRRTTTPPTATPAGRTTTSTRSPTSTAARWTASSSRPRQGRELACAAHVDAPTCSLAPPAPDVMGYHDAREIPNYWAYAQPVRAPGPHVRAGRVVEPARAPVHGLRLVGEVLEEGRSDELPRPPIQAPGSPPDEPAEPDRARSPTTPGPTSPTCCTSTTSAGATTSSTGTEPDCGDNAMSCTPVPQNAQDAGHLEPAAVLRHRARRTTSSRNIAAARATSIARRKTGTLPAVSWITPTQTVSEHPPALRQRRPGVRDRPDQRDHAEPGLELDRDLPRLGRLGRLLRPRRAADRRRERLRPARARRS